MFFPFIGGLSSGAPKTLAKGVAQCGRCGGAMDRVEIKGGMTLSLFFIPVYTFGSAKNSAEISLLCQRCGYRTRDDGRVTEKARDDSTCPACLAAREPTWSYCPFCGEAFDTFR